jgi:ribosomal protein RSM22 (predicted rRNA methylase)
MGAAELAEFVPPVTWETLDWPALDRLRERFLAGRPADGSYWSSRSEVASYDFTFGERIRWKWEAVLRELAQRGWKPPPGPLLDWGCGSGVAGRCVLEFLEPSARGTLRVFDQSRLAADFASASARQAFPAVTIEAVSMAELEALASPGTVLISHVLNELTEEGGRTLRRILDRAEAILWVEPGTQADSRALIAMRESLRGEFQLIAPCPHQEACGLLAAGNARHWCHHFAEPPVGLMADSNWVRFSQRAGIDLRRVPYSFLVLERAGRPEPRPGRLEAGWSRVLGEPRVYKGFCKILSCQAHGVSELELQKRVAPDIFTQFKNGAAGGLWRCEVREGRIVGLLPFEAERREPA